MLPFSGEMCNVKYRNSIYHVNNHMYNIYIYMCRYKYYISIYIYILKNNSETRNNPRSRSDILDSCPYRCHHLQLQRLRNIFSWGKCEGGVVWFHVILDGLHMSDVGDSSLASKKWLKTLDWHHIEWEHIEGLSFYWVTFKQDPMS